MAGSITSLFAEGSAAAAAGAGTAFCTLSHTALTQKGQYRITVYPTIGSGAGAADAGNISIVVGSSTIVLPVAAVSGSAGPYTFDVSLDGNTDVVVKIGAANNVAPYSAMITADYRGPMGSWR